MVDPLAGVFAKIERGFDHLDEFDAEATDFLNGQPYTVVNEVDPNPNGWGHIGVFRVVEEPPLMLGLVAGEAVGQFRSALDHLMTSLIRLRRPTLRRSENFPIFTKQTFVARSAEGAPSPKDRIHRLVRPEHLAMLEGLQADLKDSSPAWPGGPRRGLLLVLQWLTNMDKHELVHPVFATPYRIVYDSYPYVRYWSGSIDPPATLEDGTQLYHVQFADETHMEVPLNLAIDMALGPPPMLRITANNLRQMGGRVLDIARDFREATPEFARRRRAHRAPPRVARSTNGGSSPSPSDPGPDWADAAGAPGEPNA